MKGNPKQSGIPDSIFHAMDYGFQYRIPDSLCAEPGFRIPIVCGITDSLRRIYRIPKPRISDSTTNICWIPDCCLA